MVERDFVMDEFNLFHQILTLKRRVSEETTSMDLNDRANEYVFPGVNFFLKKLRGNEINFENCSSKPFFKNPSSSISVHP